MDVSREQLIRGKLTCEKKFCEYFRLQLQRCNAKNHFLPFVRTRRLVLHCAITFDEFAQQNLVALRAAAR
jgi:hypothetical protein